MYVRSLIFFIIILGFGSDPCRSEIDCAMAWFDGSTTNSARKVHCGSGYHTCGSQSEACCSDVVALPVELTLVILGPVATFISALLTIFVLKVLISSALSKDMGKTNIDTVTLQ